MSGDMRQQFPCPTACALYLACRQWTLPSVNEKTRRRANHAATAFLELPRDPARGCARQQAWSVHPRIERCYGNVCQRVLRPTGELSAQQLTDAVDLRGTANDQKIQVVGQGGWTCSQVRHLDRRLATELVGDGFGQCAGVAEFRVVHHCYSHRDVPFVVKEVVDSVRTAYIARHCGWSPAAYTRVTPVAV